MSDGALQLRDIFVKNIEDKVDGVIKASDDSKLADEVREYVLTREIQRNLELFLDAYNDPSPEWTNGVWISGFFGSGKSHLLKILSHVIGDTPAPLAPSGPEAIGRAQVIDIMKAKAREAGNDELEGLLEANLRIGATSLLFNIDSKAQKGSKTVLADAFIRVFDEARGYYGANKYVAKMERDLDANGCLEEFERQFEAIAGKPWSKGRTQAAFSGPKIDRAFSAVTGEERHDILKDYQKQYAPTIADFADDVADWLGRQPSGHRLIFLVDEVGQFIGSDTDRMLNLQTVAEELFSRTNGRVWVIVTSQEDIDDIIGDRNARQGIDLTKIKGRFAINLKLSSADAIEVIQKRLLVKNERGEETVDRLWDERHDELDALFTFQNGARQFKNVSFGTPEEDFKATYPFINYEFALFQEAMRGMSAAGFFEGQHRSVGERSLLSTISAALVGHKADPAGSIIPFSALYDGIAGTIQSSVNHRINEAERELDPDVRPMALSLLKALLLVKHVKGFKATVRNLRILVLGRFGEDLPALEHRIQETLDLLERQNYVHRNTNSYEYLTNDEQAIESEIKNIDIDDRQIRDRLGRIVGAVLDLGSPMTVDYGQGRQKAKFQFGLSIDRFAVGRSLANMLNISTPMDETPPQSKILQTSGARNELRVILDDKAGATFIRDLVMAERTDKYVRLHVGEQGIRKRIIEDKRDGLDRMRHDLDLTVGQALNAATLAYNGNTLTTRSRSNAASRITEAMRIVISRLYTNFTMVEHLEYTERDLPDVLAKASSATPTLEGTDEAATRLDIPADDIYNHVAGQLRRNITPTVRDIISHYEAEPYGWPLPIIQACLCQLVGTERIRLIVDSARLPRTDVVEYLTSTRRNGNVRVTIPKRRDPAKLRELREFAGEYLGLAGPRLGLDAEDIAHNIKEGLAAEARNIENLQARNSQFAFVRTLDGPLERLRTAAAKPEEWILETFPVEDADNGTWQLLDDKDEIIDPIRKVLNGTQRATLADGLAWIATNDSNFTLAPAGLQHERDTALATANDPRLFENNGVNRFRTQLAALREHLDALAGAERERALAAIDGVRESLVGIDSYRAAREDAREHALRSLDDAAAKVRAAKYIADIRQTADTVRGSLYLELVNQLDAAKDVPVPQGDAEFAGAGAGAAGAGAGAGQSGASSPDAASAGAGDGAGATSDAAESRGTGAGEGPGAAAAASQTSAPRHAGPSAPDRTVAPMASGVSSGAAPSGAVPAARTIRVTPPRPKPMLVTEDDVDEFLDEYRDALMTAIKEGKRVLL